MEKRVSSLLLLLAIGVLALPAVNGLAGLGKPKYSSISALWWWSAIGY